MVRVFEVERLGDDKVRLCLILAPEHASDGLAHHLEDALPRSGFFIRLE
jgi:hypothetical protein